MAINHPTPQFHSPIGSFRFGDWLSGFTDGEGSFVLGSFRRKQRNPEYGAHLALMAHFRIAIRTDDRPILENIQFYFGCGNITNLKASKHVKNAKPTTTFYVTAPKDLVQVIIPHFEEHPLQAKKAKDFVIWRQGVELIHCVTSRKLKRRRTKGGFFPRWKESEIAEFHSLVQALKSQRTYNAPIIAVATPTSGHGDLIQPSLF
jgi:hypothetical protein